MKFMSVCSGIEAASVAWNPLGWEAIAFSEVDPFPCAVLAHHHPDVPNLGDMTAIASRVLTGEVEAPDLLCGGTPCQAFSVAGLRESLADERGNLTLKFVELANAIDFVRDRSGRHPAIIFWENVPGVLSTKDNAFGCFLAGLAGEDEPLRAPGGKWAHAGCVYGPARAIAWRTLDAQYFGLAQRRRRVFVVASARNDFDPAAVLFEWDGLRRDSAPSREAGKAAAGRTGAGAQGGGEQPYSVANCLTARMHKGINSTLDEGQTPVVTHTLRGEGFDASEDGTGRGVPLAPVAYSTKLHNTTSNGAGKFYENYTAGLDANSPPSAVVAFHPTQDPISSTDGTTHGLGCGSSGGQASIAVAVRGISQTLTSNHGKQVDSSDTALGPNVVFPDMQVRRLTPVECERLMGFPDNYTAIPWRNKPASECPDGLRYKALGNSWAVPVVRWIGRRIDDAIRRAA